MRLDGPTARVWRTPDVDETVPMGTDSRAVAIRRALFAKIVSPDCPLRIAPRDEDTLESIWQIADDARSVTTRAFPISFMDDRRGLEGLTKGRLMPWMNDSAIGDSFFTPVGDPQRIFRQGFVAVSGRLPPEVITRVVRQSFGRFRRCFETAAKKRAALRGRVVVRFVIDAKGAVASAVDGGSDIADKTVVDCVVKGFTNLSFPQPEGGVVSVVYPLIFAPPEK